MTPGFLQPYALLLIAAAVLLARLLRPLYDRREALLSALGSPAVYPHCRKVAPAAAVAVFALILARPWGSREESLVPTPGRDIVALVDVSNSMLSRDIAPSRLDVAKRKLTDLMRLLAASHPLDRLSIVVFAGEARLFCPPTSDFSVLPSFIQSLSPDLAPRGGSNLEAGVKTAGDLLHEVQARHAALLILTDGGDDAFDFEAAARRLSSIDATVVLIGLGTAAGGPIPLPDGRFAQDKAGAKVLTRLRERELAGFARSIDGHYRRASSKDDDLRLLFAGTQEASGTGRISHYLELGPALTAALLCVLLAMQLAGKSSYLFPLLLFFLIESPRPALADEKAGMHELFFLTPRYAAQAFTDGRYETAERMFTLLVSLHPRDPALLQGLGSVKYRLGRFAEAQELFERQLRVARGDDQFDALYNLGNTSLSLSRYRQAIQHYTEALEIDPGDRAARYNREIAKRLLSEQGGEENDPAEPPAQESASPAVPEPAPGAPDQIISSLPEGPILLSRRFRPSLEEGDTW